MPKYVTDHTTRHVIRRITHQPRNSPRCVRSGQLLLTDVLAVESHGSELQLVTKYKRLRVEPPPSELTLWHLRLQEMPTTKHVALCEGWLYKDWAQSSSRQSFDADERHPPGPLSHLEQNPSAPPLGERYCRYWFVLYANATLLYFDDAESAEVPPCSGM